MQQISVSVPASSDYLALAITFLTDCRALAEQSLLIAGCASEFSQTVNFGGLETDVATGELDTGFNESEWPDGADVQASGESFDEIMHNGGVIDPAAAFSDAPAAPSAPAPAPVEPEYTIEYKMTEKAGQLEQADFERQGWALPQLIEHGYIVEVRTPKTPTAPAAPTLAPAPPATIAPTAPQHTGNTAANLPEITVELDKRGLPWDERIHGSTKTKNVKGEWNFKRNLDRTIVPAVEAELFAMVASGQVKVSNPTPASQKTVGPSAQAGLPPAAALMRKMSAIMRENPLLNELAVLKVFQVHKIPAINQAAKPEHAEALARISAGLFHPDGTLNVAWLNTVVAQHVPA